MSTPLPPVTLPELVSLPSEATAPAPITEPLPATVTTATTTATASTSSSSSSLLASPCMPKTGEAIKAHQQSQIALLKALMEPLNKGECKECKSTTGCRINCGFIAPLLDAELRKLRIKKEFPTTQSSGSSSTPAPIGICDYGVVLSNNKQEVSLRSFGSTTSSVWATLPDPRDKVIPRLDLSDENNTPIEDYIIEINSDKTPVVSHNAKTVPHSLLTTTLQRLPRRAKHKDSLDGTVQGFLIFADRGLRLKHIANFFVDSRENGNTVYFLDAQSKSVTLTPDIVSGPYQERVGYISTLHPIELENRPFSFAASPSSKLEPGTEGVETGFLKELKEKAAKLLAEDDPAKIFNFFVTSGAAELEHLILNTPFSTKCHEFIMNRIEFHMKSPATLSQSELAFLLLYLIKIQDSKNFSDFFVLNKASIENIHDNFGVCFLSPAIRLGAEDIVCFLDRAYSKYGNFNTKLHTHTDGSTTLMYAAGTLRSEIVKHLLNPNHDPFAVAATDKQSRTALDYAKAAVGDESSKREIIEFLTERMRSASPPKPALRDFAYTPALVAVFNARVAKKESRARRFLEAERFLTENLNESTKYAITLQKGIEELKRQLLAKQSKYIIPVPGTHPPHVMAKVTPPRPTHTATATATATASTATTATITPVLPSRTLPMPTQTQTTTIVYDATYYASLRSPRAQVPPPPPPPRPTTYYDPTSATTITTYTHHYAPPPRAPLPLPPPPLYPPYPYRTFAPATTQYQPAPSALSRPPTSTMPTRMYSIAPPPSATQAPLPSTMQAPVLTPIPARSPIQLLVSPPAPPLLATSVMPSTSTGPAPVSSTMQAPLPSAMQAPVLNSIPTPSSSASTSSSSLSVSSGASTPAPTAALAPTGPNKLIRLEDRPAVIDPSSTASTASSSSSGSGGATTGTDNGTLTATQQKKPKL